MPKTRQLTSEERAQIIALHENGCSYKEIARKGYGSHTTVSRIVRKYKTESTYKPSARHGRPKLSTTRSDRQLVRLSLQDRTASSHSLRQQWQKSGVQASSRTVRRRLLKAGLRSRRPVKKPLLSKKNISDRLKFCRKYKHWTAHDWSRVIFSDESPFSCFGNQGSIRVRRRKGERYKQECTVPTMKHPETVHVWGCFSMRGVGALKVLPKGTAMNTKWYIETLENELIPTSHCQFPEDPFVFQDDGAPCHRAKAVKEWLCENDITCLYPWPGNSPDLNPIENIWAVVGTEVRKAQPRNRQQLEDAIREAWSSLQSRDIIRNLVESMPERLKAVLRNKGHHTKY